MLRLLQHLICDVWIERIKLHAERVKPSLPMLARENKPVFVQLWKIFKDSELKVMRKPVRVVFMLHFYSVQDCDVVDACDMTQTQALTVQQHLTQLQLVYFFWRCTRLLGSHSSSCLLCLLKISVL